MGCATQTFASQAWSISLILGSFSVVRASPRVLSMSLWIIKLNV
jgi:hypothetical protein